MSKNDTKTPLLIKKNEARKGSLWHEFANKRIIKQHGGFDIPEGDLHAVQKYDNPIQTSQQTSEEVNATLSDLEKEIRQLKERDQQTPLTTPLEDNKHF